MLKPHWSIIDSEGASGAQNPQDRRGNASSVREPLEPCERRMPEAAAAAARSALFLDKRNHNRQRHGGGDDQEAE